MSFLGEIILSLRIAIFAAAVPSLIRLPLRRLEVWLNPSCPPLLADSVQAERIIRLTRFVCRLARPLTDHPCQVRGLTLYYFLRRAGVDVSLVFGLGLVGSAYAGHCWLVKDGVPFLESRDPRNYFTAMYTFNPQYAGSPPVGDACLTNFLG
jgi:hypothetical protein